MRHELSSGGEQDGIRGFVLVDWPSCSCKVELGAHLDSTFQKQSFKGLGSNGPLSAVYPGWFVDIQSG
jgi:hypothetical protein